MYVFSSCKCKTLLFQVVQYYKLLNLPEYIFRSKISRGEVLDFKIVFALVNKNTVNAQENIFFKKASIILVNNPR